MSKKKLPEIRVDFYMASQDADLNEITKTLGLEPDMVKKKNEWPQGTVKAGLAHDSWSISTQPEHLLSIDEKCSQLIGILSEKENDIRYLSNKYNMEVGFLVIIQAKKMALPELFLEETTIKFLASIKASIGFDMYVY